MQTGLLCCFLLLLPREVFLQCSDNSTCNNTDVEETTTDYPSTIAEESEDPPTTVTTVIPPTTTELPLTVMPTKPNNFCWCDTSDGICDVNCCCDSDCSPSQKLVFSSCSESADQSTDKQQCYSSDFLFRKPTGISVKNDGDMFCVVKDNLASLKEFKPRRPIQTLIEFEKVLRARRTAGHMKRNIHFINKPEFTYKSYNSGDQVWGVTKGRLVPLGKDYISEEKNITGSSSTFLCNSVQFYKCLKIAALDRPTMLDE